MLFAGAASWLCCHAVAPVVPFLMRDQKMMLGGVASVSHTGDLVQNEKSNLDSQKITSHQNLLPTAARRFNHETASFSNFSYQIFIIHVSIDWKNQEETPIIT